MLEEEKERGRRLARLSNEEKDKLIAKLMFGKDWKKACEAMLLLMESWGIAKQEENGNRS